MSRPSRIPITAITVFGASSLLAISVGIVLFLGYSQAAKSTRQLWAERSDTLISAMEQSLDARLKPIDEQARFIASSINDISNPSQLDDYMRGALAAAPQVFGMAVIREDGFSRRWHRDTGLNIDEDWSDREDVMQWLDAVKERGDGTWRAPIWVEDPVSTVTLLHDVALHNEAGQFIGAFAQIVPVKELSNFLSRTYTDTGITPFVLYDRDQVLSHPALIDGVFSADHATPLPTLAEVGDVVLERLWSPDQEPAYIARELTDTEVTGALFDDTYYLYLYRNIARYGTSTWTIGAYINTDLIEDSETQRLVRALIAAVAVLILAIIASIIVGRRVSSPIKAIVRAAEAVEDGELDNVPQLPNSHIRELDDAGSAFNRMVKGLRERRVMRETLGRFVPEEVASSLLAGGGDIDPIETKATVLFCDIESFTQLTESLGPMRIVEVLNAYFSAMVNVLEDYGGVVTQFQGDAILATFNVPLKNPDHANNAVSAAQEMLARVHNSRFARQQLNIRIGINTGTVIAGAIGAEGRLNYTVHGDAVNLAARLESMNKEFGTRLMVSANTVELTNRFSFIELTKATVRGQPQPIRLYTLEEHNKKQA